MFEYLVVREMNKIFNFPVGGFIESHHQSFLTAQGREGWELVSAVPFSISEGETSDVILYLKRRL